MQLSDAIIVAFIMAGMTFLGSVLTQRPHSIAESRKLDAEKALLSDQIDRDTIKSLSEQLREAQASITKYRRRLREHHIDPDADTGPLDEKGKK